VGGVGYRVTIPLSTFYKLGEPGSEVTLLTHTHVREDALALFGFLTPVEQALFERLIAVSGVGPKLAVGVLSGIEAPELVVALRANDLHADPHPGVGKKTAERLVLELKTRCRTSPRPRRRPPPRAAPRTTSCRLSSTSATPARRPSALRSARCGSTARAASRTAPLRAPGRLPSLSACGPAPAAAPAKLGPRERPLVTGRPIDDDLGFEVSLRPRLFDEYVGQQQVVANLRVAIEAARARGEALDHVLLFGPPGVGKTSLAT